jgi:Flp pilus assembly protein TadG
MLVVVFAGIEFGDAYLKYQQLSAATSEGARKAIVSRSDASPSSTVTAAVKAAAPNLDPNQVSVNVTSSWTPGGDVTVSSTYPMQIQFMGLDLYDGTISSTRTMRVEQ